MKWLVTGGCGFIGTNVVEQLIRDGHEPVVFDNVSRPRVRTGNAPSYEAGPERPADQKIFIADISELAALGWAPIIDKDIGLARLIDWADELVRS